MRGFLEQAEKIFGEVWKAIPDWPYEVSSFGNVRRSERSKDHEVGRSLKLIKRKNGYIVVTLYKGGHSKQFLVHRLVASVFFGPCTSKIHINHLDGNKSNNKISNLEYATPRRNMLHSYEIGIRSAEGSDNGKSKLTEEKVTEIRRLAHQGINWRALANQFCISYNTVRHIVRRTRWDHVDDGFPLLNRKNKLTKEQVLEIRTLYEKNFTGDQISRVYKVSEGTVYDIVQRRTWKHV